MADSGLFDRFVTPFAAMKPVRRSDVVEKEGKPHFKLTIDISRSEPFLEYCGDIKDRAILPPPERKLYDEMENGSDSGDPFGVMSQYGGALRVSLWKNPYLIHLMRKVSVTGADGNPVTFSDSPAALILEVHIAEGVRQASLELTLRAGDEESVERPEHAGTAWES